MNDQSRQKESDTPFRSTSPVGAFNVERALRQELWLGHGCSFVSLYGDDGEMQCNSTRHRPIDFKRMPIADLHRLVGEIRIANACAELLLAPPTDEAQSTTDEG